MSDAGTSPPFELRAIEHVLLLVGGMDAARLPRYAMAEPVAGGRNVDHVAMRVSGEAAAVRRHLAEHGIEVVEDRRNEDASGANLSLYVRDPCGNTIELMGLLGV